MNTIHRFVSRPLWLILAVIILRKPLGQVNIGEEYARWSALLTNIMQTIKLTSENPVEQWLISKVINWIVAERKAMDKLYDLGITVIEPEATK